MGALVLTVFAMILGGAAQDAVVILWALFGVLGLADVVLSRGGARGAHVDAPAEVFVGETARLHIEIEAAPRGLTGRLDWPEGLAGPLDLIFVAGSENAMLDVPITALRRGTWALDHLRLRWSSRLGLFEFLPKLPLDIALKVVPNIRLVQSGQITTKVLSTLYGVKENQAVGEGSEFHQLRDFSPGMDIKTIDWKRSAKKRALVAKELRAERNHHVIVALDNGYLMGETAGGVPKIDHAITAGLATAWAAAIGGDLVGYFAYDVRPRSFVKPEPGRLAFARLRSWSAGLDYVGHETTHTLALSELNARTPKRSLIIVFTDFVDATSAELLMENVAILSKRHVVIFVALRDPALEEIVGQAPTSVGAVARLAAAGQSLAQRKMVFERMARIGVTVLDVKPAEVTARLISTYLDIKAREVI